MICCFWEHPTREIPRRHWGQLFSPRFDITKKKHFLGPRKFGLSLRRGWLPDSLWSLLGGWLPGTSAEPPCRWPILHAGHVRSKKVFWQVDPSPPPQRLNTNAQKRENFMLMIHLHEVANSSPHSPSTPPYTPLPLARACGCYFSQVRRQKWCILAVPGGGGVAPSDPPDHSSPWHSLRMKGFLKIFHFSMVQKRHTWSDVLIVPRMLLLRFFWR